MTQQIPTVEIGGRRSCSGSDSALPSNLVDESTFRGVCTDCGRRVAVWLSESWFREEHLIAVPKFHRGSRSKSTSLARI